MEMGLLQNFIFPPPPSLFVLAMSVAIILGLASSGLSEVRGKHLQYSKFWDWKSKNKDKEVKKKENVMAVSSRAGMFALYAPAFLAGAASLALFAGDGSLRFFLLASAVSVHFLKRVLEVLFVHKYSGGMILDSVVIISLSYFLFSVTSIYSQYLADGIPDPFIDLKYAGVILFVVGIVGNFYHHSLLSKLRTKDGEGYKIPRGGLFSLVICPHYLFEIIDFIGISFISPTIYTISFTLGTILYLSGRSYATRRWYCSKFPNFPKDVKAMIPYVF